jgi:hypothetical protein
MECFEDITTGEAAMPPDQSARLLQQLLAPGTADELVYSHKWEVGDVVVWDNRSMLHSTEEYDYDNASRHMHLCSMKGPPNQGVTQLHPRTNRLVKIKFRKSMICRIPGSGALASQCCCGPSLLCCDLT